MRFRKALGNNLLNEIFPRVNNYDLVYSGEAGEGIEECDRSAAFRGLIY